MIKPETQLVAITRADGGVTVKAFITKASGYVCEATDENIAAEIARSPKLAGSTWRRIERSDIPADRYFRGAWKDDGKAIAIDMPKARDIHRERMREARAPKLAALDVEYQRADERGDTAAKQTVVARKQVLRDVTADPAIEAAKTPDELRAVWPAALR